MTRRLALELERSVEVHWVSGSPCLELGSPVEAF
jgi:hypothetical protein